MATSNKILIALFMLPIVILGVNFGALYMKFKNDDYVTEKKINDERTTKNQLASFSRIDLSGFRGEQTEIVQGDYTLNYDKNYNDYISFEVRDSTLFVKTIKDGYHSVVISCHSFNFLSARSRVNIDSMPLSNCHLDIMGENATINFNAQCDTLSVKLADMASINMQPASSIELFNLEMADHTAVSSEQSAIIQQFGHTVIADSATVHLYGKTFKLLLPNN